MNWNEFAQEVHENAVVHGFYDPAPSDAETIALIHSEISEALQEWRNNRPMVYHLCDITCNGAEEICDESCAHYDAGDCAELRQQPEPHGIAVELIDVALRILDAAAAWGVPLEFCEQEYIVLDVNTRRAIKDVAVPELVTYLHRLVTDIDIVRAEAEGNQHILIVALSYPLSLVFTWLRAQNLDPEALLLKKHEYNKTRPYRHGGKRI